MTCEGFARRPRRSPPPERTQVTDTDALNGRELDAAVAESLGWRWVCAPIGKMRYGQRVYLAPPEQIEGMVKEYLFTFDQLPPGVRCDFQNTMPSWSAPDCSGLAPVLAWLTEHRPTREQAERIANLRAAWLKPDLVFQLDAEGQWEAAYSAYSYGYHRQGDVERYVEWAVAPTLPEAACRLLVAWAGRKT